MKIGIIGGGASGVFAAIRIKQLHPDYEVIIFERNDKLLKKIYATGNGRCNFANSSSIDGAYNDDFAYPILKAFNHTKINEYFDSIGIKSRKIDNLYYPYSLSAATVAQKMIDKVNELKIQYFLNTKITAYNRQKEITINGEKIAFDKIIFACGGRSAPQLGTDGIGLKVLENHGYKIENLSPSLCPIKVKENVNKLDGVRVKAKVTLCDKKDEIYSEDGEVQFRSDSISGIVVFNMAFMINKLNLQPGTTTIKMDFVPDNINYIKYDEYSCYLNEKLATYLAKNKIDIHSATFTYKSFYGFDISHVSSGGVSLKVVTPSLESKIENGIYFIGEVLNVDGKCGGYNLMWAFASAEKVANSI